MATHIPEQPPRQVGNGLVDRIKSILLTPKIEWPRIDAEPTTASAIFLGWVVPLAAIGPVCSLIGGLVFGYGAFGFSYRPSVGFAVTSAVTSYLLALLGIWVMAKVIDALAPSFGGTRNPLQALKVAAYSATAGWLAGVFQIVPSLAFLGLLGLYSLYLLWIGLPLLMRAPPEKATGYTIVTIVVAAVIFIVIGALTSAVVARIASPFAGGLASVGAVSGTATVPGVGSVDLGKLDAATKQMEAASKGASDGTIKPVPLDVLQAMLPATAGGLPRTKIESSGGSAGGIGGSSAQATYGDGTRSFTLSVTDAGAMGALAALGGAFNVQSSSQTADGYEKTATVDGRMTTEKWNKTDNRGSYETVVASRFMVSAEGNAPDVDALKGAVAAIDFGELEALAKK